MIKQRTVFKPAFFKKVIVDFGNLRALIEYDEAYNEKVIDRSEMTLY